MEPPEKRVKPSPAAEDFVSFGSDRDEEEAIDNRYGYGNETTVVPATGSNNIPTGPRADRRHDRHRDARFDRRNALDRPKSKHPLPGHEPWIVVKTQFGRRFVHNTQTKESFWHVPNDIWPAVKELDGWEKSQQEKAENAKWAEEELRKMRDQSKAEEVNAKADAEEGRRGRRRSESLQREDEEAMMAEIAAEAQHAVEQHVKSTIKTSELVAGETGYDSEGSYEYVEVTDDEGEERDEKEEAEAEAEGAGHADGDVEMAESQPEEEGGPVEFGEDDIAYQLAAMGQEYGLDPEDYDDGAQSDEHAEGEEDEGLAISDEDAANLFRDLLDDYGVSPFTPWDKLISDESESSILNDDRYTVLPSMRRRKEVWDAWTKDKAAQIKEERAKMEKKDPRIHYLSFLAEKATPKLYWPEFKRKYKREAEMNDRKLSDKEREKLYRDHIGRLKLKESMRKADLLVLLKSIQLCDLNRSSTLDNLPQRLLSHLHSISLPPSTRDSVIKQHISTLPPAPDADDLTGEQPPDEDRKRLEKRSREDALAERQRKVDEEKRKAEKEERFARRGLRVGEQELEHAMATGNRIHLD